MPKYKAKWLESSVEVWEAIVEAKDESEAWDKVDEVAVVVDEGKCRRYGWEITKIEEQNKEVEDA